MLRVLLLLMFELAFGSGCPEQCVCDVDGQQRKRTTCGRGGMDEIPTTGMDTGCRILVISAPTGNPNRLTVGRIFQDFHELEEICITRSSLPAIGEGSFWPGRNIRLLDLSHNNIGLVRDRDFLGLRNLRVLDLSYNRIAASPSAPFRLLSSLTTLSLACNRLTTLVPRFFYMLSRLEKLDLRGNPLKAADPEDFRDVRPLRRLHLAECQIERLHSMTYQQLPNLEELDLRDNYFAFFSPEEFRHLKRLKYLHLDGNNLTVVVEKTFDGHHLRHLGLSRNRIFKLSNYAFFGSSIQQLDLSHNDLESVPFDSLTPVAHSLESLDLSFNPIDSSDIELILGPAIRLKKLSLSGMGLEEFPDDAVQNNRQLRTLDLSHNAFRNFSARALLSLSRVEEIDLSHNEIRTLDGGFLDQVLNMTALNVLRLHSNPWSCRRCSVLPLLRWLRDSHLYGSTCDTRYDSSTCMRCGTPLALEGRTLHSLSESDLEPCGGAPPQSRVLRASSNVPLIAVSTAAVVLALATAVCAAIYRRQGAVYYTKEGGEAPYHNTVPEECIVTEGARRAYSVTLEGVEEAKHTCSHGCRSDISSLTPSLL